MSKNLNKTEQTKYDIKCAFMQIMETKKLEDITIREISDISGYHRSTIYLYFKNVSDILIQIENDLLDDFRDNLHMEFEKNPPKNIDDFVKILVSSFRKHSGNTLPQPILVLLGENGEMSFYNTVKQHLINRMMEFESVYNFVDDDERDYPIEFVSSGIVSVIRKWFEGGMDIPVENIISYLAKYMLRILQTSEE